MFDHSVGWPLTFLPGHDQIYDIQGDVSGFINLGIDPSIFLTTLVPDGTPFGAVWQPFTGDHSVGPFTLGKGSSNFAFLDPVPASTGPAQLSGVPNPSEPISNMDPLDPPLATESDIWSLNPVTLELAASWTNPDGSRIPVTIFFDDNFDFGSVGITGDLDAVISAAETLLTESNRVGPVSPAAIPVRLFYVPADVTECFLPSP
ncbi:hypothetical protein SISSUDRAFT_1051968 [Sistotremastrum suecicum HHB10207 ss-3]|uniref:Uncharacterized protein n=1 Tax=Sistotremastrum suecicum HHB10207 ss-3 TaxID=1314776 RepID=A0A166A6Z2_9AGAM|nr:hypothetical protein SISSUDRAFT_1051968 [Sistotremastrum suecicum HHB10207 ss-3]